MSSVFGLTVPFLILFTLSLIVLKSNIYQAVFPDWLWIFGFGGLLIGGTLVSVVIFAIPTFKKGRILDASLTPIFIVLSNFILMIAANKTLFQLLIHPKMGW